MQINFPRIEINCEVPSAERPGSERSWVYYRSLSRFLFTFESSLTSHHIAFRKHAATLTESDVSSGLVLSRRCAPSSPAASHHAAVLVRLAPSTSECKSAPIPPAPSILSGRVTVDGSTHFPSTAAKSSHRGNFFHRRPHRWSFFPPYACRVTFASASFTTSPISSLPKSAIRHQHHTAQSPPHRR